MSTQLDLLAEEIETLRKRLSDFQVSRAWERSDESPRLLAIARTHLETAELFVFKVSDGIP